MEEKLYQNIDTPQINPLEVKTEIVPTKKSFSPKIILLISLASFIFVLLLISLILSQNQKKQSTIPIPTPTPAPTNTSIINDSLIPSPYRLRFKEIEQSLTQDPDLPIPQIDTEVGL